MLDIFILASNSIHSHFFPPSISEVRSVAMSNIDGVTPNPSWQQIDETQFLDEDLDLDLSDEELELVAQGNVGGGHSDVFHGNRLVIDYSDFETNYLPRYMQGQIDRNALTDYVCERFEGLLDLNCCMNQQVQCPPRNDGGIRNDRNTASLIADQLIRTEVKRIYPNGFNIDLGTGQVTLR